MDEAGEGIEFQGMQEHVRHLKLAIDGQIISSLKLAEPLEEMVPEQINDEHKDHMIRVGIEDQKRALRRARGDEYFTYGPPGFFFGAITTICTGEILRSPSLLIKTIWGVGAVVSGLFSSYAGVEIIKASNNNTAQTRRIASVIAKLGALQSKRQQSSASLPDVSSG